MITKILPNKSGAISFTAIALTFFLLSITFDSTFFKADASFVGTITGRVFQDFNSNGNYETSGGTAAIPTAVDAGIANVTVSAYDAAGMFRGSATTIANGTYSLNAAGTGPYRLEFTNLPAGYTPSARSTDSVSGGLPVNAGSTVQFVADGVTSDANLALVQAPTYCQDNPLLCSQLYGIGAASQPEALFTIPYTAGSTRTTGGNGADFSTPGNTSFATTDQIGTTFGLAYNRNSRVVYTAAFMKKHAKFGSTIAGAVGGTGAIYAYNRGTGTLSEYVNLDTVFGAGTAGANPHNVADYDIDNGQVTWNAVGKVAFGGMAISDDMSNLFVMNLANRSLYRIPTSGPLNSATIQFSAFPLTIATCASTGDVRPFAVTYHEGQIYVGAVCSADSTNNAANLRMYVYQVNPTTLAFGAAPIFDQPLNYNRNQVDPGVPAEWLDWTTNFANLPAQGNFTRPQPMFTDIDFDRGNLIISLRDRMGDQTGYFNRSNPNDTNQLRKGITGGDILRACGSTISGWTLESNGRCATLGSAPQNSGEGPGEGEYYYQENYHPNGVPHDEVGNGSAFQIPGHNEMVASIFDPPYVPNDDIFDSGGFRWFVNNGAAAGTQNRGYLAYAAGDFGKANGIGNITGFCDSAPIEIGNRVWRDSNVNGVQDPGEPVLAGVTVNLYNSSNVLIATAVTDANGEYYFVSGTAADADTTDNIGIVNGQILTNTTYQIRLDNPANYLTGQPLSGLNATLANQTSQLGDDDSSDSDALRITNPAGSPAGIFPVVSFTTGGAGSNNHTLDIGLRSAASPTAASVSIEGQVFSPEGRGIRNVRMTLTTESGVVKTALSGTFGFYRFDGIEAGQTVIVSVQAKRYVFSDPTRVLNLNDNLSNIDFAAADLLRRR